jgi:DNA-binding response OmpR family regulator
MSARLLLIEDDPKMAKLVANDLKLEGFDVTIASDGLLGLEKAESASWDLIILDVMLPKMSGLDVCRTLRAQKITTPILMLTAKGQDTDKVVGFQLGADDYLTKPFSVLELIARVRALLRRAGKDQAILEDYASGPWRIQFGRHEAFRGKEAIALTSKEFQILEYLIRHKGEVISRDQFLRELWKFESELPSTRTVDNQVSSLRRKLGWDETSKGPKILTIHQEGYRFVD